MIEIVLNAALPLPVSDGFPVAERRANILAGNVLRERDVPVQGRHHQVYVFGDWELDLARQQLRMAGAPVHIGVRPLEIIGVLVQSAGELVSKDDLMSRVWPGATVAENTLAVHISAIRKAFGSDRKLLKTISGRGYRLLGEWRAAREKNDFSAHPIARNYLKPRTRPARTNLPSRVSELFGRNTALTHIRDLLSAYRLITLTGVGGIGKSKLAVEAVRGLVESFKGDILLAELASLVDPGLVPSAIANVLGLKLGGGDVTADATARAIGGRPLLLILDNCEHVIDPVAELAKAILGLCPRTTLITTSREGLRIDGERLYRVGPLDVPPDHLNTDEVRNYAAVQLFIASARMSGFSPRVDDLPIIASICRHLDGIPLAIELAAARTEALGLAEVGSRLDDRFAILSGGRRTALSKHRTLRATLDWSYNLLPQAEQCLLRHLSVFTGTITLEAAVAVTKGTGIDESDVLQGIANLVEKSLLALDESDLGGRWRLLETVRAYSLEKLAELHELDGARQRHAQYFCNFVMRLTPDSRSRLSAEMRAYQSLELDNVRTALDWSYSPRGDSQVGISLTAAYMSVWIPLGLTAECRDRIETALARLDPTLEPNRRLGMNMRIALGGILIYMMGSMARAQTALSEALTLAENLNEVEAQLRALRPLWSIKYHVGQSHDALSIAQQFLRIAAHSNDPLVTTIGHRLVGTTQQFVGQQRYAQRDLERAIELYKRPKDQRHTLLFHFDEGVMARASLARGLWLRGLVDQARAQARASFEEAQRAEHKLSACWALQHGMCPVALLTGDLEAAERSTTTLIAIATELNATFYEVLGRFAEGQLLVERRHFEAASRLLQDLFARCEKTGWTICFPEFSCALTRAFAGLDLRNRALATVDRALEFAARGGEGWYVAELLRTKGELLMHVDPTSAEECFLNATAISQEQDALSWELRSAMSLSRLRVSQQRFDDAIQLLTPVYERFTEGFSTADLETASRMLEMLNEQR